MPYVAQVDRKAPAPAAQRSVAPVVTPPAWKEWRITHGKPAVLSPRPAVKWPRSIAVRAAAQDIFRAETFETFAGSSEPIRWGGVQSSTDALAAGAKAAPPIKAAVMIAYLTKATFSTLLRTVKGKLTTCGPWRIA